MVHFIISQILMLMRVLFLSASAVPWLLCALPQGAEVKAGHAEWSGGDKSVEIQVFTDQAIVEYQSFNIQQGEKVTFIQPDRSSTVLNRVKGRDLSSISGQLEANGKVFLVNPNGIYFSPSAKVDVGSLLVSTLDIRNQDFLEERFVFQQKREWEEASIVNAGVLSASPEGFIALLAPQIQNNGVIAAKAGKVICAAGEKVTLDFVGDQLISFTVQGKVSSSLLQNGTIDAPEGEVFLRVGDAHHVLQEIVNTDGIEEAHHVVKENGRIFLSSSSKIAGKMIEIQGERIEIHGEVVSTGDLRMAGHESVLFRDSQETPLRVVAHRDLTLESNLIDIFALNHEKTTIASGGPMTLISDHPISADGHFYSGGDFSLLKTSGAPADFISLWDPIISATGSVSFGAYTGVSLLVQSTGRITPTGNIVITAPESGTVVTAGTERATLIGGSSLILRAGLGTLDATYAGAGVFAVPPNTTQGGATFTNTATLTGTDITFTGTTITINATPGPVGSIIVAAPGGIFFGANTTINADGASVTFSNAVNGDIQGRTLTINSGVGAITFNSNLGNLQPLAAMTLITSSGNVSLDGTILGGNSTVTTGTGTVAFTGTLNSDSTQRTLTINTGTSPSISFASVGNTNPLGALTILGNSLAVSFSGSLTMGASSSITTAGGPVTFTGAVNGNASSQILTVNSSAGNILFSNTVGSTQPVGLALTTTSGNMTVTGACALGANSTISTTTGAISFGSTLNADSISRNLTINGGNSNAVSFGGAVGNLHPLGTLTIATAGVPVTFSNTLTLGASSTITSSGGAITFTGAVNGSTIGQILTVGSSGGALLFSSAIGNLQPLDLALSSTSGTITCAGNVVLGGNSTVTSATGAIAFNGTLDSDATLRTLTLDKGALNTVAFGGAVGSIAPLGVLTINTNGVPVTFMSSLTLGASSSITTIGGAVTFGSTLNGSVVGQTLTLNTLSGPMTFTGMVGNSQPIGLVLQSTSGNCTFAQPLILGGNMTINTLSGVVTFDLIGSDPQARALTINSGVGDIHFTKGLAATASGLLSLSLGTVAITTTNGNVTFGMGAGTGNAFFGATGAQTNTITTGSGSVLFYGTINGDSLVTRALTINTDTTVAFIGAVGNMNPLGATIINAGSDITFSSAVVLNGAMTLNSDFGSVNFASTLDNVSIQTPLTMNLGLGGSVIFNGPVGGINRIGNITITTATGDITFAQDLVLGGNMTLTTGGGGILFQGTVNGDILGRTLTASAAAGSIIFDKDIGDQVRLSTISLNNIGPAAITLNALSGITAMGGNITIATFSSPVTFNGDINADTIGRTLTVSSKLGLITFNGTIGDIQPFALNLTASAGSIVLSPSSPLVLGGASSMLVSNGSITIHNKIDSNHTPQSLTLRSDTGNIVLGGTIGSIQPLSTLTVNGKNITIANVGGALSGVLDTMTLGAADAIHFTGTTYNSTTHSYSGLLFNYTAGALTTLASTTTQASSPSTLSMAFAPTTIQLAHGNDLQIVTNGANAILPTILGSSPENVTVLGGTGNITVGAIGVDTDIGAVFIQAGTVTLSDTIHCQTLHIESTGNILNSFGPETITTSGNATFNSYTGTVGIRPSPIHVNSGGLIYAGSQTLAVLSGSSSDNTVHALSSNPPCVLIFNDTLLLNCNDPNFVPPGTGPIPGSRPANLDVLFVSGIYNSLFNLGSDFYFLPDWIDENTLEHRDTPLYYTLSEAR